MNFQKSFRNGYNVEQAKFYEYFESLNCIAFKSTKCLELIFMLDLLHLRATNEIYLQNK